MADINLAAQPHIQRRRNTVRNRDLPIRDSLPQRGDLGSARGRDGTQHVWISPKRACTATSHTHLGKIGDNRLGCAHGPAESIDLSPGKTAISGDEQVRIGAVSQRTHRGSGTHKRAERSRDGRMGTSPRPQADASRAEYAHAHHCARQ